MPIKGGQQYGESQRVHSWYVSTGTVVALGGLMGTDAVCRWQLIMTGSTLDAHWMRS